MLRAAKPRHAKPSKAAPALAVGGLTATLGTATAGTAEAATASDFARLRICESGGNYAINTGNGYYGAYQFDRRTWQGLGYSGTANQHAPAVQDEAAARLQAQRGWQPWPACSRKLGLGREFASRASRTATRAPLPVKPAKAVVVAPAKVTRVAKAVPAPAFAGTTLSTTLVKQVRADVRQWQARMVARGWDLSVDGRFGPQSARVAARFAAEKGLRTPAGTVDATLWKAAWTAPVS